MSDSDVDAVALGLPRVPHARHPGCATSLSMLTDLTRLESAFPAFSFAIRNGRRGPRFEAWRNTMRSGLYAIITDDPCELWRELEMLPQ